MIALRGVSKTVQSGSAPLTILHPLTLDVPDGQCLAIIGPSGSGKSTLLGLIAGLDSPSSGFMIWLLVMMASAVINERASPANVCLTLWMTDRSATIAPTPIAMQMKKNSRRRQDERNSRAIIRVTNIIAPPPAREPGLQSPNGHPAARVARRPLPPR